MSEQTKTSEIDKENWYSASAIFVTRWQDAPEECPLIEERIYLVRGTEDIALEKAIDFAREEEMVDYTFEYEGRAAREEFVGIRKLISVRCPMMDVSSSNQLCDGSELTFSYFKLRGRKDLQALIDGETVSLLYVADPRNGDK